MFTLNFIELSAAVHVSTAFWRWQKQYCLRFCGQ